MDHRPKSYKTLTCFSPLNYRSIPKCKTPKAPEQLCTRKLIFLKGSSEREEGALTSREDPWVHEGGHAEVGQDEEEEDAIVDGDGWGHGARQPRAPVWGSRGRSVWGVAGVGGGGVGQRP